MNKVVASIIDGMVKADIEGIGSNDCQTIWSTLLENKAFCLKNAMTKSQLILAMWPDGQHKDAIDRLVNASPFRDGKPAQRCEYMEAVQDVQQMERSFGGTVSAIRHKTMADHGVWLLRYNEFSGSEIFYVFALCKPSLDMAIEGVERKKGILVTRLATLQKVRNSYEQ